MRVTCSQCRKTLNAPDSMAGRRVKCPGCGQPLALPALAEDPVPPPPAPMIAPAGGEAPSDVARKRMMWLGIVLLVVGGLWALSPLVGAMVLSAESGHAPEFRGADVLAILLLATISLILGAFALYGKTWTNWATVALMACSLGRFLLGLGQQPESTDRAMVVLAVAAIVALSYYGAILAFAIWNLRVLKLRLGTADISAVVAVVVLFAGAVLIGATAGTGKSGPPSDKARQYFNIGEGYEGRGELDAAVANYRISLELSPDYTLPRIRLAWVYATAAEGRLCNGKQAVKLAKGVIRQESKDPHAFDYLCLAAAQARNDQFEAAVGTAEQAIRMLPPDCDPKSRRLYEAVLQCAKAGRPFTEAPPAKPQ